MATWDAAKPDYTNDEERLGKLTDYILGDNLPGVNRGIKRSFSLYRFLIANRNKSVDCLQKSITDNGKPIFSKEDIRDILQNIQQHQSSRFAQRFVGGGNAPALPVATTATVAPIIASTPTTPLVPAVSTAPATPVVPTLSNAPAFVPAVANTSATTAVPIATNTSGKPAVPGKNAVPEVDETRNEFFDKMFRKMMYNLPTIPKCFDGVMWFFFILYNLEQLDFVGPVLSSILDTITLSLPILAELSTKAISKLLGLFPIPYASLGGEAIGYAISLIFVLMAVSLNISRKHFGTAFKTSLTVIPVVGDAMFDASRQFEIGMKRYEVNKHKMLKSVDKISPATEDFLNYYTPDSDIHPGPAPSLTVDVVKADVAGYVKKATGLDKVENAVSNATTLPNMPALPAAPAATVNAAPAATNSPAAPAAPAAPATNSPATLAATNSRNGNTSMKNIQRKNNVSKAKTRKNK